MDNSAAKSNEEIRDIFVIDIRPPTESRPLINQLKTWRLSPIPLEINDANGRSNKPVKTGLFIFDSSLTELQLEHADRILRDNSNTLWIGLLDEVIIKKTRIQKLIAERAFDYHTIPADSVRLKHTIGHAYGMANLHRPTSSITHRTNTNEIVGSSTEIFEVKKLITKLAKTDATVLVTGESGTGKELVARELHRQSNRKSHPCIVVNCGALPEALIQSELFGHEKGAFTNANNRHIGKIESAHGGTLFLDEIGDLPLSQQANLLRFLQDGVIQRVGGRRNINVDARVVAATHVNLLEATQNQKFREDLYYRINVINIHIPPLRDRPNDCTELAEYFLKVSTLNRDEKYKFSKKALSAINSHVWPGNIRELRNRVFCATSISEGTRLSETDLGLENMNENNIPMSLSIARADADVEAIKASLQYTQNNISEASRLLKISRPTLYHLISKYQLRNEGDQSPNRKVILMSE